MEYILRRLSHNNKAWLAIFIEKRLCWIEFITTIWYDSKDPKVQKQWTRKRLKEQAKEGTL